jgi:N-formylglutamate amidohydrolase
MKNINNYGILNNCTKKIVSPGPAAEKILDKKLSHTRALTNIRSQRCFEAHDSDGVWKISIKEYVPQVCVALHDGSGFPFDLEQHCLLASADRIFEEDPHTAELVVSQPIVFAGMDSRYYYDLNRSPEHCDQTIVFGRRVWKRDVHPLSSLAKQRHEKFYALLKVLVDKLVELFGYCLIIDIHSYNYSRIDRETPLFNLGTANYKREEEHLFARQWQQVLADISFPGIRRPVAENDVFKGDGYLLHWVQREFPQTCLTMSIDIKKIYCNEVTGEIYPLKFKRLSQELNKAIHSCAVIVQEKRLP